MTHRRAVIAVLLLALAALTGCGLGEGRTITGSKAVDVQVTRDFGASTVDSATVRSFPEGETVLKLLQREFKVTTRYGGGFVQSIEGLPGGKDRGRPTDWFFYVNGIEASTGAGDREVTAGDRIWWDRHDWGATMHVPAVVGSFPEPFIHGTDTKRAPLVLQCAGEERSCDQVSEELQDAGVVGVSRSGLAGTAVGGKTQRVVVGPWSKIRNDPATRQIEEGPKASGVFARPSADGRQLTLLDATGATRGTLGAGAGLVAATRLGDAQPTWVVTGTDDAGVAAAAGAFRRQTLRNRFAVAVDQADVVPLPATLDQGR